MKGERQYAVGTDMVAVKTDSPLLEGWEVCDNVGELKAVADKAIGQDIRLGVRWKGSKIPADQLKKVMGTAARFPRTETGYILYYNPVTKAWEIRCTTQTGSGGLCKFHDDKPATPGFAEVGTIHTHPGMAAWWSTTDHKDQDGKYGIHCVLGLDNGIAARYKWTIFTPAHEYDVKWEDVAEPVELGQKYEADETWVKLIEDANKPVSLTPGKSNWRSKFPRLRHLWNEGKGQWIGKRELRDRTELDAMRQELKNKSMEEILAKGPTDGRPRQMSHDEFMDELYGRERELIEDMKATGRTREELIAEDRAADWNKYEEWRKEHPLSCMGAGRRALQEEKDKAAEVIGSCIAALLAEGMERGITIGTMLATAGIGEDQDCFIVDLYDHESMKELKEALEYSGEGWKLLNMDSTEYDEEITDMFEGVLEVDGSFDGFTPETEKLLAKLGYVKKEEACLAST